MATITSLPQEIYEIILINNDISIEDVLNFTSTCNKLKIIFSNKFWEKKFYERCHIATRRYKIKNRKKNFDKINLEKKIKASMKCFKQVKNYVSIISINKLTTSKKIKLERLLRLIAEDSLMYCFILDELNKIDSSELLRKHKYNLTSRYYFGLISHYLKQYRFTYKLFKFLNMPKEKQLLEQLLTIVAQYFEPHISYSVIRKWLDDIAQKVRRRLKIKYPMHSINSNSFEKELSFWKDNNIYNHLWNPTEVEEIMEILEQYIFSELEMQKFLSTLDLHENEYLKNISEFLRRHLLTFIFHSVARRLGIHCIVIPVDFINEDSAEILIWNPNYNTDFEYIYFLYMKKESYLSYPTNIVKGSHIYRYNEELSPSSNNWIDRYINKLKNNKHSQLQIIVTYYMSINFCTQLHNCNIYCKWKFNFLFNFLNRCLMEEIEDIEIEYRNITRTMKTTSYKTKQPERRTKRIKFAVGMIVKHLCNFYYSPGINNKDGIIVGWHNHCNSAFKSKLENISLMFPYLRQCYRYYHICNCKKSSVYFNQPHYIILTERNRICYVPQDLISKCLPKLIDNLEIGRFFSSFKGTYYVPNKSLVKQYPRDTTFLKKLSKK